MLIAVMISPEFKKQYSRLNSKQKEAVDTIEGPVMVIAGPGTGKTTILTLRIAQILCKTDTPSYGILAITYTDAGVKAMKQKLRQIIGAQADDVRIHTFHSFAVSVIRDYPDHFPHLYGAEPLTEIEARNIVLEILESREFVDLRPAGRPDLYVEPIIKALSESKKEALTPEMIKSRALEEIEKIKNDETRYLSRGPNQGKLKAEAQKQIQKNERTILLSGVYQKYEEIKSQKSRIDFDDMIFELERALRRDNLLLRLLQEQYLYLLVDEHQDTNDAQNELILLIADFFDVPNVFIVGDEKQAIYRFQGASVENFLKFSRAWRDVKIIQLDKNYRSNQKILDAAFHLIEHNYAGNEFEDLRVKLVSNSNNTAGGHPVILARGESIIQTEEYLVSRLKEILKKDKSAQIAIIVRKNSSVGRLKRLCESRDVGAESIRNVGIFEHPTGRLFFDLLSAIADPLDRESLGKTILAGLWMTSPERQIKILRDLRSGRLIEEKSLAKKLKNLRENLISGDPMGFLYEAAEGSGYVEKISKETERVEVWRGILEFAETILRSRKNSSDTRALAQELLSYRDAAEQKQIKVVSGDVSARVKIMTAHGSKGLEFDYCFLPYATESFWMSKNRASFFALPARKDANRPFEKSSKNEEEVKDSRRLFYVALTRAKKQAEILTHAELEGGEADLELRFISELGSGNIKQVSLKNIGVKDSPKPKIRETRSKLEEGYINEAKRLIQEKGLSVTALNHFLECPNMFLYRSVLKLPDRFSAAAEKGTAMHEALANVFKSKYRDLKKIEKQLKKTVFDHLDRSFLKKVEIETLKDVLEKEIPLVAIWLQKFISSVMGKTIAEKMITGEMAVVYGGKKTAISLHGRLDLIIIGENEIEVFDYKTRKKMSLNQIKGETKNSDSKNFRQLVFYHFLLSQNPLFKGRNINCSLVFLTPDQKSEISAVSAAVRPQDIQSLRDEIQKLVDSVFSGSLINEYCEKPKCQWCSLRKAAD